MASATNLLYTKFRREFLGSVIDGRGSVIYKEGVGKYLKEATWIHQAVNFISTNGPLLEAFHAQFGGDLDIMHHAGETVNIRGKPYVLKNNSARWTIGTGLMKELIAWAKPMLPLSNALTNQ